MARLQIGKSPNPANLLLSWRMQTSALYFSAMNLPDNFGLELASRLALHEALLENLYTNLLRKMPQAQERWKDFEDLLVHAMGDLQPPRELQSEEERQWLEQQRAASQNLARQFAARVASHQGWNKE